ncbi:MAG: hypothetical protein RLY35_506 [Bacteroidota bacterium]
MRGVGFILFVFMCVQVQAQWAVRALPTEQLGFSALFNGGQAQAISSFVQEAKQDTWKTNAEWRVFDFKDNQFLPAEEKWMGIGPGFVSDSMVFYAQATLVDGKTLSKLHWKYAGQERVLMGEDNGNDAEPHFDGQEGWLYFSSDRQGGYGGWDIYRVKWINGQWSIPQNLGPGVNTNKDERYPIMHAEGLCFSSVTDRGDWDIFIAPHQESFQVRWQMETPINSLADDFQWIEVSPECGWLSSNRDQQHPKRNGLFELNKRVERDSFCFVFDEPFQWKANAYHTWSFETTTGCVSLALGVVHHWQFLDKQHRPLRYEAFHIENKSGEVIAKLFTDGQGRVSWEYLGLQLGEINWLKVKDESLLLADNGGGLLLSPPATRPEALPVLFRKNESTLEESYHQGLSELGFYLLMHPTERLKLIGSCDASGDALSNERLAWERAFMVQAFLMAHGALLHQIDVEIHLPQRNGENVRDRKVDIVFQ